jgi:hypothetical protein
MYDLSRDGHLRRDIHKASVNKLQGAMWEPVRVQTGEDKAGIWTFASPHTT